MASRIRIMSAVVLPLAAGAGVTYFLISLLAGHLEKAPMTSGRRAPAAPPAAGEFSRPVEGLAVRWVVRAGTVQPTDRFETLLEFRNDANEMLILPDWDVATVDGEVRDANGAPIPPAATAEADCHHLGWANFTPGRTVTFRAGGGPESAASAANLEVGRSRWVLPPGRYELRGVFWSRPAGGEKDPILKHLHGKLWVGQVEIPPVWIVVAEPTSQEEAPAPDPHEQGGAEPAKPAAPADAPQPPPLPQAYAWLARDDPAQSIRARIAPPAGFHRVPAVEGSFARWLRFLPLKPGRPPVHLFDGDVKANQEAHFAVLDMDVGAKDLQQCADAIMRLRAEYLYGSGRRDEVRFRFTNGEPVEFARWAEGYRPAIRGSKVAWARTGRAGDSSYKNFREYLELIFTYCGTRSLSRDLAAVGGAGELEAGDVFIRGGSPGHAAIVVDVAVHASAGRKAFLLAQSYMPAQEVHLLRNPADPAKDPWYVVQADGPLRTPEYTFEWTELKRFR